MKERKKENRQPKERKKERKQTTQGRRYFLFLLSFAAAFCRHLQHTALLN